VLKAVKVPNKDGRDRADEVGVEAVEEVFPLSEDRGWGMDVNEGEGTRPAVRSQGRAPGQLFQGGGIGQPQSEDVEAEPGWR